MYLYSIFYLFIKITSRQNLVLKLCNPDVYMFYEVSKVELINPRACSENPKKKIAKKKPAAFANEIELFPALLKGLLCGNCISQATYSSVSLQR